jgi:hypothetical protein
MHNSLLNLTAAWDYYEQCSSEIDLIITAQNEDEN